MISFLFVLFTFLFFTSVGYLILLQIFKNKMVIYQRVSPWLTSKNQLVSLETNDEDIRNKSLYIRFVQPVLIKGRMFFVKRMPKQKMIQFEKKLQAAGNPFGISAGDFVLIQYLLPVFLFLLFMFLLGPATEDKLRLFIVALFVSFASYGYIHYYLIVKSKQRTMLIDKAMPDFFDLLNVSIEAGMGLDGALRKVAMQMNTPLSKEFLSTLEDMKLGKSRKQAFAELRERVPSDFFKSVMSSIIQADQMGIGMSKVLRAQTQRIREKQRFNAKEQAMKAPVKMLIPMVIFIFPTLFIVLLGPVLIKLITEFL
ncbi:type II secretion system F family protein [Bacillus tuaregi]|uniref:type II secretion system F family protein n=1 Tax=Bacillus tuaregi TaxID=1816695 RepID=UPI0008F8391B|nr:type II secretion system F family protein [Bacillus tuaregi]